MDGCMYVERDGKRWREIERKIQIDIHTDTDRESERVREMQTRSASVYYIGRQTF